jgi:hypothetical protein
MILKFPDLDTLHLALTAGAVPPAVSSSPVVSGEDDGGALWVETAETLPRASQNELKKLGVQFARANGAALTTDASCWAEILPLSPEAGPPAVTDQTPVLFEVTGGPALTELVSEILRLGNDRQSFRWLEDAGGEARSLLRVVGPPYYSLLRAIDRGGKGGAPAAFVERAPRVWVELGYSHPLAAHVKPPDGKLLLLQPPRRWTLLDDAPFRDVYDILEFTLPAAPAPRADAPPQARIRVTPTLSPGGPTDGAELWVLRDGVEELNRFVQNADDHLLGRLAFAVGERDGRTTVVVRVRQSRQTPPVLVLRADAYKQYLKLPNLFVPAGTRLRPPLRRDAVRKLLADDPDRLTWLAPGADGSFTPESLPENAFRPLSDWVDYVLDRDREELRAWVQASQFDFEGFVCPDDGPARPKKSDGERKRGGKLRDEGGDSPVPEDLPAFAPAVKTRKGTAPEQEEADPFVKFVPAEPSEAQKRLKSLEERFIAAEGGLDVEERTALWPELAALNAALGQSEEAGICWMNALWAENEALPDRARAWFRAEAAAVPVRSDKGQPKGRSWVSRLSLAGARDPDDAGGDLDRLLAMEEPTAADLRALAAYLVRSAVAATPPEALVKRLSAVQHFLETHERLLPVRAVWLAWSHLSRLAGNDVLGLTRARDRLLARLYTNGLRPEEDLPSFLRFAGAPGGQRFQVLRKWMTQLCERVHHWAGNQGSDALYADKDARTVDYIDLLFSFALARLGETDASRRLHRRAEANLKERDDAHHVLMKGFEYRIEQALAGKPHGGPLPTELLEYLEMLAKAPRTKEGLEPRYVIDRMRGASRVLEPDQQIDAYRHVYAQTDGDLAGELARLPDLLDAKQVGERIRQFLRKPPKGATGPDSRAKILRAGLDQAPRVSEEFARELLDLAAPAYDGLGKGADITLTMARAELLEKALFVAAHFNRVEHLPHLVSRFEQLLESQRGGMTAPKEIVKLVNQCFRGLRKLGMRDEIDRLLALLADVVLEGRALSSVEGRSDQSAVLQALLHVAGGWLYFGRDERAEPALKAARSTLFAGSLIGQAGQHTDLACAYVTTLGQAPVEVARRRLDELFDKLTGVRDTLTTNAYYSLSQLKVVEAVVRAVVSDDFTLGSEARRWLDDDEFLVRRRIHRELREMTGK